MPKFSVIATDYEFHVPRNGTPSLNRGLMSLIDQTFSDFEILLIHDGPKSISYDEELDRIILEDKRIRYLNTPEKMPRETWGHHSRDYGMRLANGQYFIHFNPDNYFVPNAFEKISTTLDSVTQDILIYQIRHHGFLKGGVLSGLPPVEYNIDALQLVAHRDIWESVGYWHDYSYNADGLIYQDMCQKYPWTWIPDVLGDNY